MIDVTESSPEVLILDYQADRLQKVFDAISDSQRGVNVEPSLLMLG
jgi:hypothetical protein